MATGMDFSHLFTIPDNGYNKETVSAMEANELQNMDVLKQTSIVRPPRSHSIVCHSMSSLRLLASAEVELEVGFLVSQSTFDEKPEFSPVLRSGSCAEAGPKPYMEDEHVCIDDLLDHLGRPANFPSPGAFYGVFDGHCGSDAACFVRHNILRFIVEDSNFPVCVRKSIKNAFMKADHAFADDCTLDVSSGTTALTAIVLGRSLVIANVGDCRAVLGRQGRAIELSKDHKPNCLSERCRIERLGGFVYDGYLNGQLSVARALGDWHVKGPRGSASPLSAEPELHETSLTEDDEFLIMGSDGLWDVMSSQCAVTMTRNELMLHNDPERCSKELVGEALRRNSFDNLTAIVVCFSTAPPAQSEKIPQLPSVRRSISSAGMNLLRSVLDSCHEN